MKKLALAKETIQNLNGAEVDQVAGGIQMTVRFTVIGCVHPTTSVWLHCGPSITARETLFAC